MAKKKSKEQQLADIAFAAGRATLFESDDEMTVAFGPEIALAKWKEQTGGRKLEPSDIERARRQWIANGRPKEGIFYPLPEGNWYLFDSDSNWLLKESTEKNFKQ